MRPVALFLAALLCAGGAAGAAHDLHAEAQAALLRAAWSVDPNDAALAQELVQRALDSRPDDARSWVLKAWNEMSGHRFAAALQSVRQAHALGPPSVISLGLESDALVELGRYDEALPVVQRLLDRDPALPALARAAHLRFLHGDTEGAIELLRDAPVVARAGAPERFKVQLQLAELYLHLEDFSAAHGWTQRAAATQPDRTEALAMQARIAAAQANHQDALALYLRAQAIQPSPEYALGAWRAARAAGDSITERRQRRLLEGMARLDAVQGELYRRVFIEFFGEQAEHLQQAQRLARTEVDERPDLYSHAWMAWTLIRAGQVRAGAPHRVQALRLGTRDAKLRELLLQPLETAQP